MEGAVGESCPVSLDHALCEKMAELVESLTTTGSQTLDNGLMKQLKKICKTSDAYVEHCFQLVISQLGEEHAEIRLSAFQVINELFSRSHRFRELLVADMQEYLELTVETNVDLPLPPPKPAARALREQALRAMQEWHTRFGKAYKKLGLGYTYLKNCKHVDFVDIQARSDAERRRAAERQRRLQLARTQKLNQVNEEMSEIIPELRECLTQCENCFQLLLPNMAGAGDGRVTLSRPSSSLQSRTALSSSQEPEGKGSSDARRNSKRVKADSKILRKKEKARESSKAKRTSTSTNDSESPSVDSRTVSGTTSVDDEVTPLESAPGRSIFDIDDDESAAGRGTDERTALNAGGECIVGNDGEPGLSSGEGKPAQGHPPQEESTGSQDVDSGRLRNGNAGKICRNRDDDRDGGETGVEEKEEEEDGEEVGEDEDGDEEQNPTGGSGLQQHGLQSWTSINININVDADGVIIQEDADNTDVLRTLEDQQRLLSLRFLSKINAWLETLTKMSQSDKVKQLIDLKGEIKAQQDKYREMRVRWNLSPRKLPRPSGGAGTSKDSSSKRESARKGDEDDEEDDDDDGEFDEVPDKEGYEADIPEELKEEYGLSIASKKTEPDDRAQGKAGTSADWHPVRSADMDLFDPASQAGSIAALKEKLRKIREETSLPPGYHTIPAKKVKKELSEEERRRQELLKRAPVLSFGTDLAHWENPDDIQAPVIFKPDTDARNWISAVDEEEVVLESVKDLMKTRVMSFTGTFKPVKWKCRAPLPSGTLCERMDREKCPFHGKIIARDELGNPSEASQSQPASQEGSSSQKEETPAWRDPELLRDIEGATGHDLGSASVSTSGGKGKGKGKGKKGKGKAKKYPGLTDIRKINNTSRNRLEKIVMNKSSLKRVAAAMSRVDQKKYMDKFGNNFNYAL